MNKIDVNVISIEKDKLKEGSKFIFLIHPMYYDLVNELEAALDSMGVKDYIILPIEAHYFKAYEIVKD